ncbi:hypothetical protein Sta7437_2589 [Stanieria cyanosphaera PCC 7437]|uniref:Uncharacterized protein n=1 Tax=Stanieria cyanosphaera (strain ATCC 29371 / PCC 7437) TaxID=111780 RepID=K9XU48_STAC7|nr:hypothetical protein Sta7437_2589 [Stanieria cyanosphaera PCC 7437]
MMIMIKYSLDHTVFFSPTKLIKLGVYPTVTTK